MNVIDHHLNVQAAVNASRIHHQWLPDEIGIEEGISPDTVRLHEAMQVRNPHPAQNIDF